MRLRGTWICAAIFTALSVLGQCAGLPISVFLVRHAEKAATPADNPGLNEVGQLRAKALDTMLADAGVTGIYASEFARAQLTVKPLADRLHLEIHHSIPAKKTQDLAQAILKGKDRVVLVAGHSNTVPEIIRALGGGNVPVIQAAWEYDQNLW